MITLKRRIERLERAACGSVPSAEAQVGRRLMELLTLAACRRDGTDTRDVVSLPEAELLKILGIDRASYNVALSELTTYWLSGGGRARWLTTEASDDHS